VNYYFRDRKTFSAKVFEVSSMDLVNMGIVVISYTIHDIKVRSHLPFNDILDIHSIFSRLFLFYNLVYIKTDDFESKEFKKEVNSSCFLSRKDDSRLLLCMGVIIWKLFCAKKHNLEQNFVF